MLFFCTLPDFVPRKRYKLPGGTPAIFFVCVCGLFFCCPVLCLIFYTPEGIKYRAVPWPFFFLVLESKRVAILCQNVDQLLVNLWLNYGNFGDFLGGVGASAGTPYGRWEPTAAQRRFGDDFGWILASFWGAPGSTSGAIWAPESPTWSVYVVFCAFFGCL